MEAEVYYSGHKNQNIGTYTTPVEALVHKNILFPQNNLILILQSNSTYPEAGYPDRQLTGSAWPFA
jgi:hypothetical protein